MVGFGYRGVFVSLSDGSSFAPKPADPWLEAAAHDQGWNLENHVRTLADVNGDGRADVIGYRTTAKAWLSTGDGFDPAPWSVSGMNWENTKTIRTTR